METTPSSSKREKIGPILLRQYNYPWLYSWRYQHPIPANHYPHRLSYDHAYCRCAISFKSSRLSERRQRYRVRGKVHRWLSLHGIHMNLCCLAAFEFIISRFHPAGTAGMIFSMGAIRHIFSIRARMICRHRSPIYILFYNGIKIAYRLFNEHPPWCAIPSFHRLNGLTEYITLTHYLPSADLGTGEGIKISVSD